MEEWASKDVNQESFKSCWPLFVRHDCIKTIKYVEFLSLTVNLIKWHECVRVFYVCGEKLNKKFKF